jgi:predicted kinase
MPKCYQLVGVPASGKSTWVTNQDWISECVIVSTDFYVEKFARRTGKTYSEVFDLFMPRAIDLMMRRVRKAQQEQKDIIWDQTSTSWTSRRRKFNALPDYEHIAVVFQTPDEEEHLKRLATRPGKVIPEAVLFDMIWHFEMPTEEEGFKEIWYT